MQARHWGGTCLANRPRPSAGQPIRIYADARRTIAPVQREVFGSFLEHLGRAIYEGIYDPQSKLSDSNGFRKDVLDEIKKLGVPIIRYPRREFCFWIQLARRNRSEGKPPSGAGQGMEFDEFERIWNG